MITQKEFDNLKPGDVVMTLRFGDGIVVSRRGRGIILRTLRRPQGGPLFFRGEIAKIKTKIDGRKTRNPRMG